MQLPIGILIYWVKKFEENHAVITGMWYYKELYVVPSTVEEKKKSGSDLKEKRCTAINIHGSWDQIIDILIQGDLFMDAIDNIISQGDLFMDADENELSQVDLFPDAGENEMSYFQKLIKENEMPHFQKLIKDIENTPEDKSYLFDEINNLKGTALTVDTVIEVDETMENILEYLRKGQKAVVTISQNWSLAGDVEKGFEGPWECWPH